MYEQNAVDRQRLQLVSDFLNQLTAEACARAGLRSGARAIDVGCGQLGALPVLAEMVGPSGVVVGLDSTPTRWLPGRHLILRCAGCSSPTSAIRLPPCVQSAACCDLVVGSSPWSHYATQASLG
jgi:hypothetical protein